MESSNKIMCNKCNVGLVEMTASFSYLGRKFNHKILRCPVCGQVYLPESLVNGKIRQVEMALEEK